MGPVLLSLLSILITLFAYLIYKAHRINQYWKERGIPHVKPLLFIGNFLPVVLVKIQFGELFEKICKQFPDEPFVGVYNFIKPELLIKDAQLVEKIMIKDFMHFTDHGFEVDEKTNPLDSNLFTMVGKRWRALRIKLAPIFTSGKIRMMFGPMNDVGDNLKSLLDNVKEDEDLDVREIMRSFAMDVIGSCAFGIDAKNLVDPNNEFYRMGKKQFDMDLKQFLKFIFIRNFPKIFAKLGMKLNKPDVTDYFVGLINDTLEYRKKNNIHRNDFINMMIELQKKGYVEIHTKDESDEYLGIDTTDYKTEQFEISNNLVLGQAFAFLTAGFEPTSNTLSYLLYELAKHPKIMERCKEEIRQCAADHQSLTYDAVRQMTFLEQCVKETMRKHPPAVVLFRVCTKEYALPNGYIINKGDSVIIPVKAIHYDPQYYPEPEVFKPERFDPENTIPPCAFLPFGNGPRMCIAMRFVMVELKYALAKILMKNNLKVSPNTIEPLLLDPKQFITTPKNPIYLNITKEKL